MRLTLSQAKPLLAKYAIQGACESDPRVLEKINEARERLMTKPQNWRGKTQRFLFCASNSCITLPREIETVEAATVCNQPMKMRGPWYDVLEGGPGSGNLCGGDNVVDRGDGYVSFVDLDEPRNIKIYTDVPESTGARILLQGFDENGNRVRTFDSVTNAYVDGEYVGLNNATPQVSVTVFSTLDGIVKPETNGFIRIYAFTAGTPGSPETDVSTLTNWDGTNPLPGTIAWGGSMLAANWFGTAENADVVIQLSYDGVNVLADGYNPADGSPITNFDIAPAGWTFTPLTTPVCELAEGSATPPFVPLVTSIAWNGSFPRVAYVAFECFGIPGSGNLIMYDEDLNVIISEPQSISSPSSSFNWTPTPTSGAPFSSIDFGSTGGDDLSDLFALFTTFVFKVTQPNFGTLSITTDNSGSVLPWDVQLAFDEVMAPDLWNGGLYVIRLRRVITPAVTPVSDYSALMAIYHPDETNPSYRRYEIPQLRTSGTCCGGSGAEAEPKKVVVMAKLRYLPVKRGTDFLVIEHLGALKMMLLALNFEEKGDLAAALQYETKAEEILAQEIQNHIGDAATANQGMKIQTDAWAASTIPNLL